MPVVNFAGLTPNALKALEAQSTVFILPVSLMEAHGEHLPLGTDFLLSEFFARQLAGRIVDEDIFQQAVVFTGLAAGAGGIQVEGTINTDKDRVRQLIVDYGKRLAQWGFRLALSVSIHAGQQHLQAMESAYDELRSAGFDFLPLTNRLVPWFFSDDFVEQINVRLQHPLTDEEKTMLREDGHAGWWETAMMALAAPQLIRREALPAAYRLDQDFCKAALQAVLQRAMGYLREFK